MSGDGQNVPATERLLLAAVVSRRADDALEIIVAGLEREGLVQRLPEEER